MCNYRPLANVWANNLVKNVPLTNASRYNCDSNRCSGQLLSICILQISCSLCCVHGSKLEQREVWLAPSLYTASFMQRTSVIREPATEKHATLPTVLVQPARVLLSHLILRRFLASYASLSLSLSFSFQPMAPGYPANSVYTSNYCRPS